MGVRGAPVMARVGRQAAMPRYTVGHLDRLAAAFGSLAGVPNLVLAGAAYRGAGLPDCIAQGRAAAACVQALLGGTDAHVSRDHRSGRDTTGPPPDRLGQRVTGVGATFREGLAGEGIGPGVEPSAGVRLLHRQDVDGDREDEGPEGQDAGHDKPLDGGRDVPVAEREA